jgi:hypothetical protein
VAARMYDGVGAFCILAFMFYEVTSDIIIKDNIDKFGMVLVLLAGVFWTFICVQLTRRGIRELRVIEINKLKKINKRKRKK